MDNKLKRGLLVGVIGLAPGFALGSLVASPLSYLGTTFLGLGADLVGEAIVLVVTLLGAIFGFRHGWRAAKSSTTD